MDYLEKCIRFPCESIIFPIYHIFHCFSSSRYLKVLFGHCGNTLLLISQRTRLPQPKKWGLGLWCLKSWPTNILCFFSEPFYPHNTSEHNSTHYIHMHTYRELHTDKEIHLLNAYLITCWLVENAVKTVWFKNSWVRLSEEV